MRRFVGAGFGYALIFGLLACAPCASADQGPMSEDEVLLMLMSGASPAKKAHEIRTRGVNFGWSQQFEARRSQIRTDAGVDRALETRFANGPDRGPKPPLDRFTGASGATAAAIHAGAVQGQDAGFQARTGAAAGSSECSGAPLATPDKRLVKDIITAFFERDAELNALLNTYTYHQSMNVKELLADGQVRGRHYQEWDVLFDDNGHRLARQTAALPDTLVAIHLNSNPSELFEQTRPLAFPLESRSEYAFAYLDHLRLDAVSAYKFSVVPISSDKRHLRFSGTIWIEDQDLALIKADGVMVPDSLGRLRFWAEPHFVDFRSQLDGKHWFPVLTVGEIVINDERFHQAIKYSDYKRFGSTTRFKVLDAARTQ